MPNVTLVYPKFPLSYWGFQYALDFIDTHSAMPPLGLLTIAGLFSRGGYSLKLVDMNVRPLTDAQIKNADVVMASAMIVQRDSLYDVVDRCKFAGVPIVVGGPFPSSCYEDIRKDIPGKVNTFFVGEAEGGRFDELLADLKNNCAREIYLEPKDDKGKVQRPNISQTPRPRYDLVNRRDYGSAVLQFSRGCPWECEWCDITKLYGRVPRVKAGAQLIAELQLLYDLGWRGSVFLVDDNFIGNRRAAMEVLPLIAEWQAAHGYPFSLCTEASLDLAERPELMELMQKAGFGSVFSGIETTKPEVLVAMSKQQNTKKAEGGGYEKDYLLKAVRKIQAQGMEVLAGFILGADGDTEESFDAHIELIQETGIAMAMEGMLTALPGTEMYKRYEREGRLLTESNGNNVSAVLNFVPQLDPSILIEGYKRVLSTIYDPGLRNYFERCLTMFDNLKAAKRSAQRVGLREIRACIRSLRRQTFSRQGPAYLRFLWKVLWNYPEKSADAVRLAIYGYHFEKVTRQIVAS